MPVAHDENGGATWSSRRFLFWLALVASWLILLPLLWQAFAEVPSAERLQERHTVAIPTLRSLGWTVARSFAELCAVLALAWPRGRWYATRLALAALGLLLYFVWSTPLGITALEWTHRRWLAALIVTLLVAAGAAAVARMWARRA